MMSDQERKQETTISARADADNKKQSGELSEEELKKVAGGNVTKSDFTINKQADVASPKL
jgi:type VI protein secretion system component Hcp